MEISIHPNPADNETVITFTSQKEPFSLTVTDIAGRMMYEITGQTDNAGNLQEISLNTSLFPNGIYACLLKSGRHLKAEKLLVQH